MSKYFNTLRPTTLGFEKIIGEIERMFDNVDFNKPITNYPPHNIVKTDPDKYYIDLAVAGFAENEISVSVSNHELTITGSHIEPDSDVEYLHRGIGIRPFTKVIKLSDTIEVLGAEFNNGILRVSLQNIVPEEKQTRKIEITSAKKLLTE